jgi:hypothetical protein
MVMLARQRQTSIRWRKRAPSSPTSSPAAEQPFVLEYSTEGQRPLGQGLRKISSKLVIRSDRREGVLEKHRSQSDQAGEPIGTFRGEMSQEMLAAVLDKAKGTMLGKLPARGGGPGTTVITLSFEQGQQKARHVFNTGDMAVLQAFRGLLEELNSLGGQLNGRPLCALRASVEYKGGPAPHFVLTLTNVGKERICFADPQFLPPGDADCWAGAKVAELPEEKPGVTSPPLTWTQLPLMTPPGSAPTAAIVLKPGKSFSARTVTWQNRRANVRFLAIGVYSDYTGPAEIDGVYRVRGATFSDGLEFQPK